MPGKMGPTEILTEGKITTLVFATPQAFLEIIGRRNSPKIGVEDLNGVWFNIDSDHNSGVVKLSLETIYYQKAIEPNLS